MTATGEAFVDFYFSLCRSDFHKQIRLICILRNEFHSFSESLIIFFLLTVTNSEKQIKPINQSKHEKST